MYPLWKHVIAPVIEASGARRVVEIGALAGETTVKLLNSLGPEAELHVIDPLPQFDPSEHEQRFPGRYHFYRDSSHNVLPTLPAMDVALIDGDHNWYTVYNELKMLAATAREAGAPIPILFLHDVGWPYGRRDLYYAPERIPEEFRHPYAQKGLQLRRGPGGKTDLLPRGGFNSKMNNAVEEGGPRNGVMTALEDFVGEADEEFRLVVLPIYFSLAIVADEERIARCPQLGKSFDRLKRPAFYREMLKLAETLRLKEMHWGQVVFYHWQDRLDELAGRYLDLLRAGLHTEHENFTLLMASLETVREEKVEGDFVLCGTAVSEDAILARGFTKAHEMNGLVLWVIGAGPDPGERLENAGQMLRSVPTLENVQDRFRRFDLLDDQVRLLPGPLSGALEETTSEKVALLRIGPDANVAGTLEMLYDRVTLGGCVVVDGYAESERGATVDRFRARGGLGGRDELVEVGGAASWRKVD